MTPTQPSCKPRRRRTTKVCQHNGFTLIELLVVIAIIAILAAILFPVFSRARENARRSSCQSNLKQIGIGLMQYVQDYDERFPAYVFTDSINTSSWVRLWVQPYIKSTQVFACPSAKEYTAASSTVAAADTAQTAAIADPPNGFFVSSYGYNGMHVNLGYPTPPLDYRGAVSYDRPTLAMAVQPAETVWVGDYVIALISTATDSPIEACGYGYRGGRHMGRTNFLFMDGHVKSLQAWTLKAPDNFALEGPPPAGYTVPALPAGTICRPPGY